MIRNQQIGIDDAIVTACWMALKDNGMKFDPDAFRKALADAGLEIVPMTSSENEFDLG